MKRLTEAQRDLLRFIRAKPGISKERLAGTEWRRLDALERRGLVERKNEPGKWAGYHVTGDALAALES